MGQICVVYLSMLCKFWTSGEKQQHRDKSVILNMGHTGLLWLGSLEHVLLFVSHAETFGSVIRCTLHLDR
eukprot:2700767-Amphidinium_carterae.2